MARASISPPSLESNVLFKASRALILSVLLPGAVAECVLNEHGLEECNDGLSTAARVGIAIAGGGVELNVSF
ncbi:hypothetical protein SCHPADRAFT_906409 [Schizopora paradoxa]|uniref:Hydrophobin n=1 Tax=Schizopora paradoxa TaxID=27342 RepID=A0A0H2RGH3_9AGAM|nr:hypothetical protein SCHPADRAFT_906409 [Schizopora paradoxa]